MGVITSRSDRKPVPPGLLARRKRIKALRLRVTRYALAVTAVVWVAIFGQFASGNDPVLGQGDNPSLQRAEGASSAQRTVATTATAGAAEPDPAGLLSQAAPPTPLTTSQS